MKARMTDSVGYEVRAGLERACIVKARMTDVD